MRQALHAPDSAINIQGEVEHANPCRAIVSIP